VSSDKFQLGTANYKQGSYIVVEGRQKADCFFIIQQGRVSLSREIMNREEILVPGDFFGVVSTMSSNSHIETAVAMTDVVLITVRPQQYVPLIQRNTRIAVKILIQLSSRLRFLDRTLTKLIRRDDTETTVVDYPSRLFGVAEYYFNQKQYKQAFYAYTKYLRYCPREENGDLAASRLKELANNVDDVKTDYGKTEVERAYCRGDMIFAEGEPGDELFIIQSGSLKITRIINNSEVLLTMLKSGDIFGEMAALEGKPRAASAFAVEDCVVMAVNKANFEFMIRDQPQLAVRVTTLLAERIWFVSKQVENALVINPLGKIYGAMLIHLEKIRANLDSTGPHVFNFTWEDFVNALGFAEKEGYILMGELQKDKNVQVRKGRIYVDSVQELVKQTDYHRKMDKIEKAKHESRSKLQAESENA